jgi:hypothetical protein
MFLAQDFGALTPPSAHLALNDFGQVSAKTRTKPPTAAALRFYYQTPRELPGALGDATSKSPRERADAVAEVVGLVDREVAVESGEQGNASSSSTSTSPGTDMEKPRKRGFSLAGL